ncbi:MAG: heme-binding protein [Proteobacteria bacterium]|nr:heme-binding protein [Pseudomonadota bacterium]
MKSTKGTFTTSTISLSSAQAAIDAGVSAATTLGVPMSMVIVDLAGLPKAFARMDGASILSYEVAYKKAWTAAVTGAPTAGVHQFISSDAGALISMPHVGNFSVVAGGLPLRADECCVGAVGVSGATAELDLKVAEAMVAALT